MIYERLTVGCPGCGGFWDDTDALGFARILAFHPSAEVLGFNAEYWTLVAEVLHQAEQAVAS